MIKFLKSNTVQGMEKGKNMIKGSELLKQFQSCLSSGVCAELEQGRAGLPGQGVPAALQGRAEAGRQDWRAVCLLPARRGGWVRNAQCQVSSTCLCTVCGFFMCFHPFKLYLYNKPPGCERISLGKNWEVCPHSDLTLKGKFLQNPFEFGVLEGFPADTPSCALRLSQSPSAGPSVEAAWGESEPAGTALCRDPGNIQAVTGSTACNFGKDLLCLPAYRNFTGSHIV